MSPLSGLKVIDLTEAYSGPFCTMHLADFGADVTKVEMQNNGDISRNWLPVKNNKSGFFATYNRGKKSVSLDIKTEKGQEILTRLISSADVLVLDYSVDLIQDLNLHYDNLMKLNPELIYASISGFGEYGAMADRNCHDNITQAVSGTMTMTGFPDDEPVKIGVAAGDSLSGSKLCLGILMALFNRIKTGEGQKVEIAKMDAMFEINETPILFETVLNQTTTRAGNGDATITPYEIYETKDGYISIGVAGDHIWPFFCDALEMNHLAEDEMFHTNEKRLKNYEILNSIIKEYVQKKTKQELQDILTRHSVPCAPVLSIAEAMKHPQLMHRDMIVDLEDPALGTLKIPGIPIKLEKSPARIERSAPDLGEHTSEVLQSLGYSTSEIEILKADNII